MTPELPKPNTFALSISENPDLGMLGLSMAHLREAMADFALHLLASGANLVYSGDLRRFGFTELLCDLVIRYRRPDEIKNDPPVTNYLAWPVHIRMTSEKLREWETDLLGCASLAILGKNGGIMTMADRKRLARREPEEAEWEAGLTTMREAMCANTDGRILLGGQVEGYKGRMPGIAEEALLSLQAGQPVFLVGGFGGCTRDIAETLGLVDPWCDSRPYWPEREAFGRWGTEDLLNGLSIEENRVLARTPYVDEALTLVLQGIQRLRNSGNRQTEVDLARSRGGASRAT